MTDKTMPPLPWLLRRAAILDGSELEFEVHTYARAYAEQRVKPLVEALREALGALEALQGGCTDSDDGTVEAITVWCPEVVEQIRAALAAEQEQS